MVEASIASKDFNWRPQVVEADDPAMFLPTYIVAEEAATRLVSFKTKFADLPSSVVWADRSETDDELLELLGGDWRDFGTEQ